MTAATISSCPCPAILFAQAAIRTMSPWLDVLNFQQIESISPQGIVGGLQWKELPQSCLTVPPLPVAAADCTASNSPLSSPPASTGINVARRSQRSSVEEKGGKE